MLLELGTRPVAVDAGDLEGEAFKHYRVDLGRKGALDFLPSWTLEQRVRAELEVLGLNVSAHPLRFVHDQVEALGVTPVILEGVGHSVNIENPDLFMELLVAHLGRV
ncbi:MAG: hypothetical protein HGA45_40095 [Chloroflexales bacterium]|nr:hypothetical protein [Chloroflexales bacterium]